MMVAVPCGPVSLIFSWWPSGSWLGKYCFAKASFTTATAEDCDPSESLNNRPRNSLIPMVEYRLGLTARMAAVVLLAGSFGRPTISKEPPALKLGDRGKMLVRAAESTPG